jgi:glucose/arabinose dehydrogenase
MTELKTLLACLGLVVLAACDGGGDGDGAAAPTPPSPTPSPSPPAPTIELTRVYPLLDFVSPVLAVQAPADDSRWFVVEQAGRVLAFENLDTVATTSVFIDITALVEAGGELGLLGMAFDPQFAANGRVLLHYTRDDDGQLQSVLALYTSTDGGMTLDPATEDILLLVNQPAANHNGGHLAFGPDGMLYMALGDGGGSGDPNENAQNRQNLLGKILRIDVSSGTDYAIPPDNRWSGNARCVTGVGSAECPEIHAYGFRNPWRFSFDASTGELWVGDVGQGDFEEVDRVDAGGNYGWDFREGAHCFEPPSGCPNQNGGDALIDPDAEYGRDVGASVTGGYVYRGTALSALVGRYVFGDFVSGRILAHTPGSGDLTPEELLDSPLSISSFAEGEDGELYVVDYAGALYRIDAG